jgi:hypothetical protein
MGGVLRDVPLGDEPRIIRMRPRVVQAYRQIWGCRRPKRLVLAAVT